MEGIKLITGDKRRIKEEAPAAYKNIEEVIFILITDRSFDFDEAAKAARIDSKIAMYLVQSRLKTDM